MQLAAIREARAAKVAEARSLVSADTLTPEQKTAFDKLKGEITALEADEQRAQFVADLERRTDGEPVDRSRQALEQRVSVLDVIRAQTEERGLAGAALEYHQEAERRTGRKAQGFFVPMAAIETRVNTTTSASEIVPTIHRPDLYIGALREKLAARTLGVRVLTGLSGNLSIPKYGTGLTTGWVNENSAVPEGNMTFGDVGLTPKHVGGKTEMSRQLIQQSSPDVEQLVRDDLAFLIAKQIDHVIIAGSGTGAEPMGVLNMPGVQTGPLTLTPTWPMVLAFAQKLEDLEIEGGTWLTNATVKNQFAAILKNAGLPGFLLEGGRMADRPLVTSRAVPAGTLILGDFSQVLLGIWSVLDVLVNPFSEPAFSRGGVQVRAMATVGTACRYEEAFVVADDLA